MRSRSSLKKTLPGVALTLALTVPSAPAHAGIVDGFYNIIKNALGFKQEPLSAASSVDPGNNAGAKFNTQTFTVEADFVQKSIAFLDTLNKFYSDDLRRAAGAKAEKLDLVNTETHTRIVPEYSEKGLTFRFEYDDVALQDPKLLLKDLAVLDVLVSGRTRSAGNEISTHAFLTNVSSSLYSEILSPHAMAELLTNVKMGSPTAKARWNVMQVDLLNSTKIKPEFIQAMNLSGNALEDIKQELSQKTESLNAEAVAHMKKQQKALDKWKSESRTLDNYEAAELKLNDLILNNDRVGVRKMLEAYLPWAVMEPVEANAWKIWLEAIENPSKEHTTVAFRGLNYDTDKIQRRQTAQGEIFGFMSTVLTKNQGNYSRRLRSLSTNREKNGDIGFSLRGEEVRSTKMADQMTAHARNPVASSFLSFTYDPSVAKRFMGSNVSKVIEGETVSVPYGGLLVVKMDTRRIIPNVPSMYGSEIELLAPLVIFPDEVVAYKEGSFEGNEYADFVKNVSKTTGIDFVNWSQAGAEQNLNARYKADGHNFLKLMNDVGITARSCNKVFAD